MNLKDKKYAFCFVAGLAAVAMYSGEMRAQVPVIPAPAMIFTQTSAGSQIQTEKTPRVPAFPGAEGFGMLSAGGRGGRVIFVTNLEDYIPGKDAPIPGSYRAACEASGPRIIIFRVGGIIKLKENLTISESCLTIAGQTAPGDGICIANYNTFVAAHDVVIRHLRLRAGDLSQQEVDGMEIQSGSYNVIVDHCSASWGIDETLSIAGENISNITIQWCFITESLNRSFHSKGKHGYGSLVRLDGNITMHHNLYAHHNSRCPRLGTYGLDPGALADFRNNVIYDWLKKAGYTMDDPVRVNYIANYGKPGPSNARRDVLFRIGPRCRIYLRDNVFHDNGVIRRDDWSFMDWNDSPFDREACKMKEPFLAAPVQTETAEQAYERVLAGAGATLPKRDIVDQRIVEQVRNGTGKIINSQIEVGAWPEYKNGPAPKDTDSDGMPDEWEIRYGFNPNDPADANLDKDGEGYTNIEEFLNRTDPGSADPLVHAW